jgi:hypothetical protein
MTKTLIHSLTPLYVNVDVNFAQPRPYAAAEVARTDWPQWRAA